MSALRALVLALLIGATLGTVGGCGAQVLGNTGRPVPVAHHK